MRIVKIFVVEVNVTVTTIAFLCNSCHFFGPSKISFDCHNQLHYFFYRNILALLLFYGWGLWWWRIFPKLLIITQLVFSPNSCYVKACSQSFLLELTSRYLMLVLLFAACMILKCSSVLLVTSNVIATSSLIPHF